MASLSSKRTLFKTEIMQELTVVADTTPATLASTDCIIYQIVVANVTASAANFTVSDINSPALDLITTLSVAAKTTTVLNFQEGVLMKGGVKWLSGTASALNGQIFGLKK